MSNPLEEMKKAQRKAVQEFKDQGKADKKFFRYVEKTGELPGSPPLSGIPRLLRQAQMLTKLREVKLANERKKKALQAEEADRQQFLKDTTLR
tara:strand:- start:324 stop:602 length:279 start_codon:yes stop_codon:yes gene_type:complete